MFPCACSLRSTQCAALIALAAAAGISRFEPVASEPATPAALPAAAPARRLKMPSYPVMLHALANSLGLASTAPAESRRTRIEPLANGPLIALAPPTSPPIVRTRVAEPAALFACVSVVPLAREHRLPYAVGPPRRGVTSTPRASGTAVPGDSPARRRWFGRIAASLFDPRPLTLSAAPIPTVPQLSGTDCPTDFALRGASGPALPPAGRSFELCRARSPRAPTKQDFPS